MILVQTIAGILGLLCIIAGIIVAFIDYNMKIKKEKEMNEEKIRLGMEEDAKKIRQDIIDAMDKLHECQEKERITTCDLSCESCPFYGGK